MPAWRARERLRDTIDGDEGTSFSLIPDWMDRVEESKSTYIRLKRVPDTTALKLYLLCLDQFDEVYDFLRPFYSPSCTKNIHNYFLKFSVLVGTETCVAS